MTFNEIISNFKSISVKEAEERILNDDKFVLFLGRETCPFCQRFAPKIANVEKEYSFNFYFIRSDDMAEFENIQNFRNKYGVKTVPGLLVSKNGEVNVVCDSSLSEEEIKSFIA